MCVSTEGEHNWDKGVFTENKNRDLSRSQWAGVHYILFVQRTEKVWNIKNNLSFQTEYNSTIPPSSPSLYCPIWISIFRYLTVDGYITAITAYKTFLSSPYWQLSGTFSEYSSSNWQGQWGLALSIPAFFLQTLLLNTRSCYLTMNI